MDSKSAVPNLLFGSREDVTFGAASYNDARYVQMQGMEMTRNPNFKKAHYDNLYLELLVEGGLLGMVTFLLPYAIILRRTLRMRSRGPGWQMRAWVIGIYFGIAVQGLFGSPIPTFNASVGLTFAVIGFVSAVSAPSTAVSMGRPCSD